MCFLAVSLHEAMLKRDRLQPAPWRNTHNLIRLSEDFFPLSSRARVEMRNQFKKRNGIICLLTIDVMLLRMNGFFLVVNLHSRFMTFWGWCGTISYYLCIQHQPLRRIVLAQSDFHLKRSWETFPWNLINLRWMCEAEPFEIHFSESFSLKVSSFLLRRYFPFAQLLC